MKYKRNKGLITQKLDDKTVNKYILSKNQAGMSILWRA